MTGPVTTEALVESLTQFLLDRSGEALWQCEARAKALIAGPLAPLLASLQQVTAERDEARAKIDAARAIAEGWPVLEGQETVAGKIMTLAAAARQAPLGERGTQFVLQHLMRALDAADAAEASLATATSELARLRAEGEAKDRALKILLPFVDHAAGEGLMFVETEDGEHPEMDAADIMGLAAEALGLQLGSDAYLALLPAGYDAIRAARAATAREG